MEYEATGSPLCHTLGTREAFPTSLPLVGWRSTAGSFTSWNGVQGTEVCGYLLFNQEVLRLHIGDSAYKSCMSNSYDHFCQMLSSTQDLPWKSCWICFFVLLGLLCWPQNGNRSF